MLDKQSPVPIYHQIEEQLKQRIQTEEFMAGDMIPSERELAEAFEVSRMTVRQAITNMVSEGILHRKKGKGTFVAEHKMERKLQGLVGFTEEMRERGMNPSSKVLFLETVSASKDIAQKLQIEANEEVYVMKRLRYADEEPISIEHSFLPKCLAPKFNKEIASSSLYHYMEQEQGLEIGKAEQVIEATVADTEASELLNIEEGSPLLVIERVASFVDGTPFEAVRSSYRGDRYKLINEIHRG
ncbi:GntR family transcriptional regulator [Pontibacillus litoralis]|uniref:GntR family transcriptional regulator n=1 Tax=Pontibacillus litoralis JSM 072002 TaxID=1385512 RepID=A0A0A5GAN8_9BACI|nr:GntR family transcriptional regulator [Pontibacillus litoralis]KGX88180.1 GntR family transcriptional regulator [Pontibacillus litoralis JSM 072002]